MSATELYPWTESLFETLLGSDERRAHAYLLAGHSGLGKTRVAIQMAKSLLCQQNQINACGSCQSCKLFDSGSHPDLHVLQSEKRMMEIEDVFSLYALRYLEDESKRKKRKNPSAIIAINQVRAVIPDINSRPHISGCRLIIINTAEEMNINAANSLLKSLEEPPPDSYFILISHEPGQLLPTLRSRCNRVDFRIPDSLVAINWLETQSIKSEDAGRFLSMASGNPVRALEMAKGLCQSGEDEVGDHMLQLAQNKLDPSVVAASMIKANDLKQVTENLQYYISRLIKLKSSAKSNVNILNENDLRLIDLGNKLNFRELYAFLDKVSVSRQLASGPLDPLLALEDDLVSWQKMFAR